MKFLEKKLDGVLCNEQILEAAHYAALQPLTPPI